MSLFIFRFLIGIQSVAGAALRPDPEDSDLESPEEIEAAEFAAMNRIFDAPPNAICTESLAIGMTGGYNGLTNLAIIALISSYVEEEDRDFVLAGFACSLGHMGADPNILMTPEDLPTGDDGSARLNQAHLPYSYISTDEVGQFSIFSMMCKPVDTIMPRVSFEIAKMLFSCPAFDFNKPIWKGGTQSTHLLEAVLLNILDWESWHGEEDMFGLRNENLGYWLERESFLSSMEMLQLLGVEHSRRMVALDHHKMRVDQCRTMLMIANRKIPAVRDCMTQMLQEHIFRKKPPSPIVFDAALLTRVFEIIERCHLLKVNRYVRMIIPQEYHNHPAFFIDAPRYMKASIVYQNSGLHSACVDPLTVGDKVHRFLSL